MKKLSIILILVLLLQSCSKENDSSESKKNSKAEITSKHKDMKEQEAPPREIIDAEAEDYSVDQVIAINKEIPVLELITAKKWSQSELQKLGTLQETDTLRIENTDALKLNLSFCKEMKALKKVSLKNSKISLELIKSLSGSKIDRLDLSGSNLSETDKASLNSILKNVKVIF